jgi:hypothetical protein
MKYVDKEQRKKNIRASRKGRYGAYIIKLFSEDKVGRKIFA